QAEDGIRDLIVTGVQTCALPIFEERLRLGVLAADFDLHLACARQQLRRLARSIVESLPVQRMSRLEDIRRARAGRSFLCAETLRSEERRVGKEWRSGWSSAPLER